MRQILVSDTYLDAKVEVEKYPQAKQWRVVPGTLYMFAKPSAISGTPHQLYLSVVLELSEDSPLGGVPPMKTEPSTLSENQAALIREINRTKRLTEEIDRWSDRYQELESAHEVLKGALHQAREALRVMAGQLDEAQTRETALKNGLYLGLFRLNYGCIGLTSEDLADILRSAGVQEPFRAMEIWRHREGVHTDEELADARKEAAIVD